MDKAVAKIRLTEVLNELGITKAEAARRCKINKQYFYHIANGTKPVSITKLSYIADVLDVELADLIARKRPLVCKECGNTVIGATE